MDVEEQGDMSFKRVNNQIGKRLLLFSNPRETLARLVLQTIKTTQGSNNVWKCFLYDKRVSVMQLETNCIIFYHINPIILLR